MMTIVLSVSIPVVQTIRVPPGGNSVSRPRTRV